MFEKIKKWHKQGLWTEAMIQHAQEKGVLTAEQVIEILASK